MLPLWCSHCHHFCVGPGLCQAPAGGALPGMPVLGTSIPVAVPLAFDEARGLQLLDRLVRVPAVLGLDIGYARAPRVVDLAAAGFDPPDSGLPLQVCTGTLRQDFRISLIKLEWGPHRKGAALFLLKKQLSVVTLLRCIGVSNM